MTTPLRNRVDLHTHSLRSDGILAPTELYAQMRAYGMRLVALSDHDTLAGYRELHEAGLGAEASVAGPKLIPAVEINTLAGGVLGRHGMGRDGEELHILGYGVDVDDPAFEVTLARQRTGRQDRIRLMVERLRGLGLPVDDHLEPVSADRELAEGRPHVARAMIRAGYVGSVDEAFERYLDVAHPAYVPRIGIGPRDAIEAIRGAGGSPVLAHSPAAPDRPDVITELQRWGLVGLEVHYHHFSAETVARMGAFARERALLITGGSDYHGDSMSYADAQAETLVPDTVGEDLLEAIAVARAIGR